MKTLVNVKFLPIGSGKEGALYYSVDFHQETRLLPTGFKLFAYEWDEESELVIYPQEWCERTEELMTIQEQIRWDLQRFKHIIMGMAYDIMPYTVDDVVEHYRERTMKVSLKRFASETILQMKRCSQFRTAENYQTALSSFLRFRKGKDLPLDALNSDMLERYQSYLLANGKVKNTSSFYMRILRAIWNRANEMELIWQKNPFQRVYTGVDKTVKRAVPLEVFRALRQLNLKHRPSLAFARDLFLFSFYTRGMSFVDICFLRKTDLCLDTLTYRRRKTGQLLSIRWERCMQEIVNRYKYKDHDSPYLLPIIQGTSDEWRLYRNAQHLINTQLKAVSEMLGLTQPLTMYVARHSWATIAYSSQVPLSVISEAMGHGSENTTRIYLASLNSSVIDNANHMILEQIRPTAASSAGDISRNRG